MNIKRYTELWNAAQPTIKDVRYLEAQPGERLRPFPLPANMFLFTLRGSAVAQWNGLRKSVEGFRLIHGARGHTFQWLEVERELAYYVIYYKAELPLIAGESDKVRGDKMEALHAAYELSPPNPLILLRGLEQLSRIWTGGGASELPVKPLHAKTAFGLWIGELLRQLNDGHELQSKRDIVEGAKQYIHDHYAEPITLDSIAETMNYSVPYLSKQFKSRTGRSPIDYLIGVRIDKAQEWLARTDAGLQEIAEAVGYTDISYFTKSFKKHTGQTPGQYKEYVSRMNRESDRYKNRLTSRIVRTSHPSYTVDNNENHYQTDGEGELLDMRMLGSKGKIAMLVLGTALIMGACSGNTGGNGDVSPTNAAGPSNGPAPSQSAIAQGTGAAEEGQWPRTYKDGAGREVVIEKQPERVMVAHFAMMEYFFALETPPIASPLAESILTSFETLKPFAEQANVKDIGQVRTPNLEMMIEEEPDLIVAFAGLHNDVFADLDRISTVAMLDLSELDWKGTLREYAKLIGKETLAENYIGELETMMNETRGKLAHMKDKKVSFLRPTGNGSTFYVLDDNSVAYMFDQENGLGLQSPGDYDMEEEVVSLEGVHELDPDVIFLVDYLADIDSQLEELNKSKVWQSLKAPQAGQVFPLDVSIDAGGPIAIRYATEQVLRALAP